MDESSPLTSPTTPPKKMNTHGLTSTPNIVTAAFETEVEGHNQPICEGSFLGKGRHKDGTPLRIIFQVTLLTTVTLQL